MRAATAKLLASLNSIQWFHSVGKSLSDANVGYARSWAEAIELCDADHWLRICHEMEEGFYSGVHRRAPKRHAKWNDVAAEVKAPFDALADAKLREALGESPNEVLVRRVKRQVLSIAIDTEFSDVIPDSFHASLVPYYLSGHFPCGWDGELDEQTMELAELDTNPFRPILPIWTPMPKLSGRLIVY